MPIRIYEIAKKLGSESKEILAIAKQLGIKEAKIPSSSVDKITGEFLEVECRKRLQVRQVEAAPATLGLRIDVPSADAASPPSPTTPPLPAPSVVSPMASPQPQTRAQPPPAFAGNVRKPPSANFSLETPSQRFERRVRQVIEHQHPFCTLSNILLFHAERARFVAEATTSGVRSDYAFELDHLLHRATDKKDVLTIVECKNQPVVAKDLYTWEVSYADALHGIRRKNVQEQLQRHARALRAYVNPLSRDRQLRIEAIVVSSDEGTIWTTREVDPGLTLHLVSEKAFAQVVASLKPSPLRVVQSDLLGLLRLGIPVSELGHPELSNAIAYIERCRRDLDTELFRAFTPTGERWAINGSAGMGKSVLLAYSLFVLTTDRVVEVQGGHKNLVDFAPTAVRLNLPPLGQRGVYAFALKEKQRQVIQVLFRRFVEEFSLLNRGTDLGIRRPSIGLWTGKIPDDCQVLLLDEAHDLPAADANEVATWANAPGRQRYLLIACDRHQKLRLVGRDESIIDGVSFSLKTKKLRLNYRNPFAVYSASLGLMFRWFARDGPKVVPNKDDLENGFGFTVEELKESGVATLSMRNDAHPANSWAHSISTFPTCEAALARLRPHRFRPQDVLWVRFDDEEEHFDYEQLSCFTYHNLNSEESVELADKYVKGQDFPIVVIEGFSVDMDDWSTPEAEQRMWQRRRELYICCSRATSFLFFIPRSASPGASAFAYEVQELVGQLSSPAKDSDGFARTWRLSIAATDLRRRMDVFVDMQEPI